MSKIKITWSSEALETYDKIIEYIFSIWGIKPVIQLHHELKLLIKSIETNHKLCPKSKLVGLRKCVLSKQTSLIYSISRTKLVIVTFIDNRSQHTY